MAYFGLVTTLQNVRKDENSDRLWLAEVFNEGVIVGPDMVEGQKVLYLPTDGCLERWFGDTFSLFRKNIDGTPQGGYLEDNAHIRAIRLRGNQSSGIVIAYDSIVERFGDPYWKIGEMVDSINGKIFCYKYVPKRKEPAAAGAKKSYKGRKAEGITYPEFSMHSDTAQLAYNLDAFKPGDQINISLKMHGCFIKGTRIRMADNTLKEIERIKPGDMVLGYDTVSKKVVPTKVVHTFKNAPSSRWNKIKFSREYIKGDKRGTQTSTWNHQYWVENRQEWVQASDLNVGDVVETLFPSPILTTIQKEVMIGLFLGDGCLMSYAGRTAEMQLSHKKEHEAILDWLQTLTQGFLHKEPNTKISGYGTEMCSSRTTRAADLYQYMKDKSTFINKNDASRLKEGLIEAITPLALALWYIGDGSLSHTEQQQDRAALAVCRYSTKNDLDILDACLRKFNIAPTFYIDPAGYNRIRLNKDEANKLFELIAPYIPPIMQYKLSEPYRGQFMDITDQEDYNPKGYVLSPQTVLENEVITDTYDEYDLETELHNYVVNMTVVHNTSQRSMKTYAEMPNGFFRRLFHMKKRTKPVYVCGTRRTVVNKPNGGYYGNDGFRFVHHDKIAPFVEDSYEIYYEIVGYYGPNDTDTIMPIADNSKINDKSFIKKFGKYTIFNYGCQPGESEMYVYRITANNGEKEFTPKEIVEWCKRAGVKHVPYLEDFKFTTIEDLNERINNYFIDLADPIGKTHVKEGVVVRILNRPSWRAYKSKTWEFKVLSGIAVENLDANNLSQDMLEES